MLLSESFPPNSNKKQLQISEFHEILEMIDYNLIQTKDIMFRLKAQSSDID